MSSNLAVVLDGRIAAVLALGTLPVAGRLGSGSRHARTLRCRICRVFVLPFSRGAAPVTVVGKQSPNSTGRARRLNLCSVLRILRRSLEDVHLTSSRHANSNYR